MPLNSIQAWLSGKAGALAGRRARAGHGAPVEATPPCESAPASALEAVELWPSSRIAAAEAVWGEGFLAPGGAEEVARLARPMGLSGQTSLLLVGAGTGGPVCSLAAGLGAWVTGCESDPKLEALAARRAAESGLGRRANIESWNPEAPDFDTQRFHHILACEPLREAGPTRERILEALARATRPNGQLTLVEIIATGPFDLQEPTVATWLLLERRRGVPPTRAAITQQIESNGFDIRVVEDLSERHMRQILKGWHTALRAMKKNPPTPAAVSEMAAEAERWMSRHRLLRAGRLRLLRWHATGKKSILQP